jgi:hypothetical protein
MKTFWPLLLFVILHQSTYALEVKHAPTVDQCRADQKLWFSKLDPGADIVGTAADPLANVSFRELNGWLQEMIDCHIVDPEFSVEYNNNAGEIAGEKFSRVEHFLQRHHLYGQFRVEDVQGNR